jgi:hypothetical protein
MLNSDGTVTLSLGRYYDLLSSERKLDSLRGAGVDNWQGYECAYVEDMTIEEVKVEAAREL